MRITDALLGEHGVLYALFDHAAATLPRLETLAEVRQLVELVATVLVSHAKEEDGLLFPALEAKLGTGGLMEVMREEHQQIDEALIAAREATDRGAAAAHLVDAMDTARPHFQKEEEVVFRMAEDTIEPRELQRMGAVWAASRGVGLS